MAIRARGPTPRASVASPGACSSTSHSWIDLGRTGSGLIPRERNGLGLGAHSPQGPARPAREGE